jgi:hypothetical protein
MPRDGCWPYWEHSLGIALVDRVWVFPPLVRGRKEWGLVAVSRLTDDPARRELVTGRYSAELTGGGVVFHPEVASEGEAPPERLPRIMDGVVRRSGLHLGLPREIEIGGDPHRFERLLLAYGLPVGRCHRACPRFAMNDTNPPSASSGGT